MIKKIGDYEILGKIGQGGMATVYKGLQSSLDRPVAIKVLSNKMTKDPQIVDRFNREALVIARLSHPNIIHIIDRGVIDGLYFFVMDFIEGVDFSQIIKQGSYGAKKLVDVVVQVSKGLAYAHKNGVVHRDIKPSNIIIDNEGNCMLVDFGIAQLFSTVSNSESDITVEGAVMGTLAYMSPEQKIDSGKVTPSTDIYSLGVVMYEMFTKTKPLGRFKLPSEINPRFPKPIEQVILKCLEPDPLNRYKSADALRDTLLKLLQGAHINTTTKKKVFQGITNFEEKFSILDIIKETPFSTVYLFEDKITKKLMIVKKIKNRKQGLIESKILAQMSHENIVKLYGVSGTENLFIIVIQYINGGSLKERLIKQFTWRETMKIGKEICKALSFAHKNRVVHGNLRPSNILFTDTDEIKVGDFGLEEHYTEGREESNWYHIPDEHFSPVSDVYSLGVIFYEMITGVTPVWLNGTFIPDDRFITIPEGVKKIITTMIDKNPSNRFPSMDAIINQIHNLYEAKQKTKNKMPAATKFRLLLLSVILLLASMGYLFYDELLLYIKSLLE